MPGSRFDAFVRVSACFLFGLLGFRVLGLGLRVQGLGCRVYRALGLGFRV